MIKKIVIALIAALLLAACGHDKPLEAGYVTGKGYHAAHNDHYTTWNCYMYDPKTGACKLNIPQDNVEYVPDQWVLHVKRDSNGKNEDVGVSQSAFNSYQVNDRWRPAAS